MQKIDVRDLLGSIELLQAPGSRIGWPDDPTLVSVSDSRQFTVILEAALRAFQAERSDAPYVVNVELNSVRGEVWMRFVLESSQAVSRHGQIEPGLSAAFHRLRVVVQRSAGDLHYWGGNNYFDVCFPFRTPMREDFPDVDDLPWDQHYRCLLERASWDTLRGRVYRFSRLAESIATRCGESGLSSVLIPSVGICVHPWLFAHRGLSVIAIDRAMTAITVVSQPHSWPRLFSLAAFDRWDISQCASYAMKSHPDQFAGMPDLEELSVRDSLQQRITFGIADWALLPLANGSVDAIFATNALPRRSIDEEMRVLKEWVRVLRPGGLAFIAQHNSMNMNADLFLKRTGWTETGILQGMRSRRDRPDSISDLAFLRITCGAALESSARSMVYDAATRTARVGSPYPDCL